MAANNLFNSDIYVARRLVLRKAIGKGQILLLGNQESAINFKDNVYPFRQDSCFLYYFGISLPGLVGLIDCDQADNDYLIGDDLTIDDIIWTGPQPRLESWAERIGIAHTSPSAKLKSLLRTDIHYLPPYKSQQILYLSQVMGMDPTAVSANVSVSLIKSIVEQRNIKSSEEIEELRKAVDITSAMHLEVMKAARPGMKEHELVGIASRVAHDHHVSFSFSPIMTIHGQTLHNHDYSHTLREGDLVLFDGGTESPRHYAGDMTRTFPVSRRYDNRQREIYDIVYSAHRAAVEALTPGIRFIDIHLLAAQKLVEGLTDIGLMKGDPEEAVRAGAHTLFFQCGLGHMMGLDVHDMENLGEEYVGYTDDLKKSTAFGLKSLRLGRALHPGFVLTVEPGIYIIPELIDLFKSSDKYTDFVNYEKLETYRDFGGIRVEEDFVITEKGADLLGTPLASSAEEIEEMRR